ncbi:hypothetical protein [Vibrio sp. 10N.261.55.A7]|uniref:hypothetical protein n=1 Tax=Vibrio TaxID=662 RepID=UPI000C864D34|nr:hypothetical protein [Vibrio sp. 10N.261.55.A7]PMJ91683.1 hypothetical protein BCU12_08870 [Vibrio sp. 10N.261.55.A7]
MREFSISRINTPLGIFRLKGKIEDVASQATLTFTHVDIMGTDGWVALDTRASQTLEVIEKIRQDVINHLS